MKELNDLLDRLIDAVRFTEENRLAFKTIGYDVKLSSGKSLLEVIKESNDYVNELRYKIIDLHSTAEETN